MLLESMCVVFLEERGAVGVVLLEEICVGRRPQKVCVLYAGGITCHTHHTMWMDGQQPLGPAVVHGETIMGCNLHNAW
jgi:hypothetical protein